MEIREVQAEGPYYLIGMCMGGLVAYEMAQQLRAARQHVGLLGLLDTWPPEWAQPPLSAGTTRVPLLLGFIWARLRLYVETVKNLRGLERRQYLRDRVRVLAEIVARRDLLRGARQELYLYAVTRTNTRALDRYIARTYEGSAVVFRAGGRKVAPTADLRRIWRGLVRGGLEFYSVPGDDSGLMLIEPQVRTLATQLHACLERAQPAMSRPGRL